MEEIEVSFGHLVRIGVYGRTGGKLLPKYHSYPIKATEYTDSNGDKHRKVIKDFSYIEEKELRNYLENVAESWK